MEMDFDGYEWKIRVLVKLLEEMEREEAAQSHRGHSPSPVLDFLEDLTKDT